MFSASSIRFHLLLSTAVAASLALPCAAVAQNLPVPPAPNPDIVTSGNTMTVNLQNNAREVFNWNSFDIANNFAVNFTGNVPSGQAVLNRVTLNNVSDIDGSLTSNSWIQVFLINPAGIIFGSQARVDVGSLVASTLGITDNDFLLGDAVPTELTFQGNVSTGITVNGGAQLTTESGPLALIGGFIDVQSGSIVNGATDVAFVAANSVNIPADPGSPLTYAITTFGPTSVSNGITVGGQVSGRSVALIQENRANAVNALLFVSTSATITATKGGGGDIVLSLAARTTSEGTPAVSPGRVENHGDLTASGNIYLGGAVATSSGEFHAPQSGETIGLYLPRTVENDGTLDAGNDVLMQARHNVTNSGTIIAGDDVTLSAVASVTEYSSAPETNVGVTNSGDITAGGNVTLAGSISISAFSTDDSIAFDPAVQVLNDGAITAGGDVTLSGAIDVFNIAASTIAVTADVNVINGGPITAGGDVILEGTIDIFNLGGTDGSFASEIDVDPSLNITNNGTITADGDVNVDGEIDIFNLEADKIVANATMDIANIGTIAADGDVNIAATIDLFNFAKSSSGLFAVAASSITAGAILHLTNSGAISAGGDANLTAEIELFNLAASEIDANALLSVKNGGTISADGNVGIAATIDLFNLAASTSFFVPSVAASTVSASANLEVANNGMISAGGDVDITADIELFDLSVSELDASANLNITNGGAIIAGGNVDVAGTIGLSNIAGSSTGSSTFAASAVTATANVQVTNNGKISTGGDASIVAAINLSEISATAMDMSAEVGIANSGTIKAGGDARLNAAIGFSNIFASTFAFASTVHVTNVGTISAQGDAFIFASLGDVTNSGKITADNVFISTLAADSSDALPIRDIVNSGEITARGDANLIASRNITNSGVIDVGGVANLDAGADIDNSGSITAGGDAILTAVNNILDSSGSLAGSIAGADVALSAGGSITAGTVTARDDIAIRAPGPVTTLNLTSGATIGSLGPVDVAGAADELLPGVDLSGHDVDVDGSTIAANVIRAFGPGSDIRLRAPVTASREDLDFAAGGNVTAESDLAATDVAIDAGGTITAGNISARDDITLRAGDTLNVGTLTSGVAIGGTGPVDTTGAADALLGANLAGHDLFVQGGHVSLTQATANGTGSDLTVRATTGELTIANGTAGGTITLVKEGTTGILTAGTLLAGTGATLTSATDIDANTVQTTSGDLAFSAGRDVTVHNPLAADDVAIDAGRNISTQNISARDDIAIRAGGTLDTGTLASGVTIGGTGPIDTAGAADTLLNETLAGHDISVQAADVSLADPTANGIGSDLTVRATNGDLSITNGQAGGTITLVKEGSSGTLSAGTLIAGTGASLTSSTGIDADNVQSASGDVDFDAVLGVTLGTVLAQAGNVNILADDLDILGGITGSQVSITNRSGGNAVTVLGDASAAGAFTLTEAELNRINAPIVSIDSLGQNLLVGNVAFDNQVGSTRINLLGTARVDVVGEIDGSGVNRTLQIGGTTGTADPNDATTLASIIRIAPMSSGGGRIILGGGSLDLRGVKIGVGLDDGFLTPLGLTSGGLPVSTNVVQSDWIGNFNSTLYGIPGGYADPVVISAGSITVTYTDYALFQNTGSRRGLPSGVNADNLFIISSGGDGNGFELFGTIDQVGGIGAAFLVKPTTVSMGNSRINGCLILTGGGCGGTPSLEPPLVTVDPSVPPPGGNNGDVGDSFGAAGDQFAQQDLISTDEDQAFSFDSLVGTNNEGLLGVLGVDDAPPAEQCAPDDKRETCRAEEKPDAQ